MTHRYVVRYLLFSSFVRLFRLYFSVPITKRQIRRLTETNVRSRRYSRGECFFPRLAKWIAEFFERWIRKLSQRWEVVNITENTKPHSPMDQPVGWSAILLLVTPQCAVVTRSATRSLFLLFLSFILAENLSTVSTYEKFSGRRDYEDQGASPFLFRG